MGSCSSRPKVADTFNPFSKQRNGALQSQCAAASQQGTAANKPVATRQLQDLPHEVAVMVATCGLLPEHLLVLAQTCKWGKRLATDAVAWEAALKESYGWVPKSVKALRFVEDDQCNWRDIFLSLRLQQPAAGWLHESHGTLVPCDTSEYQQVLHMDGTAQRTLRVKFPVLGPGRYLVVCRARAAHAFRRGYVSVSAVFSKPPKRRGMALACIGATGPVSNLGTAKQLGLTLPEEVSSILQDHVSAVAIEQSPSSSPAATAAAAAAATTTGAESAVGEQAATPFTPASAAGHEAPADAAEEEEEEEEEEHALPHVQGAAAAAVAAAVSSYTSNQPLPARFVFLPDSPLATGAQFPGPPKQELSMLAEWQSSCLGSCTNDWHMVERQVLAAGGTVSILAAGAAAGSGVGAAAGAAQSASFTARGGPSTSSSTKLDGAGMPNVQAVTTKSGNTHGWADVIAGSITVRAPCTAALTLAVLQVARTAKEARTAAPGGVYVDYIKLLPVRHGRHA